MSFKKRKKNTKKDEDKLPFYLWIPALLILLVTKFRPKLRKALRNYAAKTE